MYIDESGFGQGPVYVFGGVLSTAEKWAAFSDEWQAVLDMPSPGRIGHFKADDAINLTGEFHHWRGDNRDEKCRFLGRVMHSHVQTGFVLHMSHADFAEVMKRPLAKELIPSPYFIML